MNMVSTHKLEEPIPPLLQILTEGTSEATLPLLKILFRTPVHFQRQEPLKLD